LGVVEAHSGLRLTDPPARFDVILATVQRTVEVARFVESLALQTYPSVRLIVVDQNSDNRLDPVLARYEHRLPILRLRSEPGLSRARNSAFQEVAGEFIAFPDDDCWYAPDLLERVAALFASHSGWDGISGKVIDAGGRPSSSRWSETGGDIKRLNAWTRAVSIGIFLRREVLGTVGEFDEALGVGSGTQWGSGEETDYVLRALAKGFVIRYEPTATVFHPQTRQSFTPATLDAARRYGAGMGRVLRKHRYPAWFVLYQCCRALGGSLLALAAGRAGEARYHWAVGCGRAQGWMG
jgi:GT2 family glycosyltransferase